MYMHLIGRYLIHDLLKFNVNWLSNYVLSQDSVSRCMFVCVRIVEKWSSVVCTLVVGAAS